MTVLGWRIDTPHHITTLPSTRRNKLSGPLAAILNILERVWKKNGTKYLAFYASQSHEYQRWREFSAGCSMPSKLLIPEE